MTVKKKKSGMKTFEPTTALQQAVAVKETAGGASSTAKGNPEDLIPSSINLRRQDWRLLRLVARARADREGGRDSVSKVMETLIEASRKALEAEAREQ